MITRPLPQSGTVTFGPGARRADFGPSRPMGRRDCDVCGRRMPGGQCPQLRGCRGCPTRRSIIRGLLEIPAGRSGKWSVAKVDRSQDELLDDAPAGRTYTVLRHDDRGTIYADHPRLVAEIEPLVRRACTAGGHVLLGGLGLGIAAKLVLARPRVQAVTVLEIAPEVIELVAPSYVDPRLEIIEADVRAIDIDELVQRRGQIATAWLDIWDTDAVSTRKSRATERARWAPFVEWLGLWPETRPLPGGGPR